MALGRVKVITGCSGCVFVFGFIWFLYFCILKVMEEELAALAELRMKEESATELSVGLLVTKHAWRSSCNKRLLIEHDQC